MLRRILQFIVILLFGSDSLAGQTYGYFFGGGGDPAERKTTIFLGDLKAFSKLSIDKKWTSRVIHNGGHPEDDAWISTNIFEKPKKFSTKQFQESIADLKKQISAGSITPNDQLLIYISTHGLEPKKGQPGHELATTDGTIDVSDLQDLRSLAEKNKVKLAIVDTSCYSGATLNLATDKTCVVTMASSDVAYSGDSFRLLDSMSIEKNLEDAFLKSRAAVLFKVEPGQPQISTDSGREVGKLMSVFSGDLHDKFDSKKFTADLIQCKKSRKNVDDIEKLLAKINSNESLMGDTQVQAYKNELMKYRAQEAEVIDLFNKGKGLDSKFCFKTKLGLMDCSNFSEIEFRESFHQENFAKKKDPDSKEILDNLTKIKDGSQYKKYISEISKMKKLGRRVYENAMMVSKIEREIYSKLYSKLSQGNVKGNPCRDFKL